MAATTQVRLLVWTLSHFFPVRATASKVSRGVRAQDLPLEARVSKARRVERSSSWHATCEGTSTKAFDWEYRI